MLFLSSSVTVVPYTNSQHILVRWVNRRYLKKACSFKEQACVCRPPCTIFELIYNGPKAIGKHCCLIINALGSFAFIPVFE